MSTPDDHQIDLSLRLEGFDPDEAYPEHSHEALRRAYRATVAVDECVMRDMRAENARLAATVQRVEALLDQWESTIGLANIHKHSARELRAAIEGADS